MELGAVLTDLDGTLLDRGGVLGAEARAAVDALRRRGIPVVPLTSKTEVELHDFLSELDLGGIGGFENGAGIVAPGRAEVHPSALPMSTLHEHLAHLSELCRLPLRAVSTLSPAELVAWTGLPERRLPAMLARRFGLPFLAPPDSGPQLARAAGQLPGTRLTRGGIFWHLSGDHGKEDAVRLLLSGGIVSRPVAGLGDAPNDAGFLALCDVAVLIPGAAGDVDARLAAEVPAGRRAALPGGAGWAEAVRTLLGASR